MHRRIAVAINIFIADTDPAFHAGVGHRFMHAVQTTDKRGFSATGRPNDGRGVIGLNLHADAMQRLVAAKPGIQALNMDFHSHAQLVPFKRPLRAIILTTEMVQTMSTMRTNAPPQAWRCHSSNGEMA